MRLGLLDGIVFFVYFVSVIALGVLIAYRSKQRTAHSYFLASKKLPWYAVGASFIASNISTEHFIGMIGWSFIYGMAIANWAWMNVFTFSMLIWIFLPFYLRGNVSTMPEFLERRFNKFCRYVYAVVQIVGLVIALLGGVMFAGGKALNVFFPGLSVTAGILLLAVTAGTYTIYGGLLSTAWADVMQYCLLMVAGIVIAIFGLVHVGGLDNLFHLLPEKFITFYPADHEMVPWTGLAFGLFSVGLWYSCANQFMVQRCLGARSEWDARMGVVMAGFSQALLPLMIVIPGMVAFALFQHQISDGDTSWPYMVRLFLPAGLTGLVLAGLASAIMSTLAAITNSSATILTLDLYQSILRPGAGDRELHRVGRISGAVVMTIGVLVALVLAAMPGVTVFGIIQTVFFYLAPPIAAAFLLGIIWPRITPAAAAWGMGLGFLVYLPLVVFGFFHNAWASSHIPALNLLNIAWLEPYNNFMHHTFGIFLLSGATMILLTPFTRPKSREELRGVVWSRSALGVLDGDRERNRGLRNLGLWWGVMAGTIFVLYGITIYKSSSTDWLEAEKLPYAVSGGATELQPKGSLPNFTLWTGKGQLLFSPAKQGDSIAFQLRVEEAGQYRIGALVTMGPGYGSFRVAVNDKPTSISFHVTRWDRGRDQYELVPRQTGVFEAGELEMLQPGESAPEKIAGDFVMQRIELGTHMLNEGENKVSIIAAGDDGAIGIDQWIVTRVD